jgi:hypothetical protein
MLIYSMAAIFLKPIFVMAGPASRVVAGWLAGI